MYKENVIVKQGRVHRQENISCQDKSKFVFENNIFCLAIADGAGSRKYAEIGAEIAVDRCTKYIVNEFDRLYEDDKDERICQFIIDDIIFGLKSFSSDKNYDIRELASTIAVIAIKEDKYIIFSLGDSTILKNIKNKRIRIVSPVNFGAKNITVLTTTDNAFKFGKCRKGSIENIDGFVIMTDGAKDIYYDIESNQNLQQLYKNIETVLTKKPDSYSDDCCFGIIQKI